MPPVLGYELLRQLRKEFLAGLTGTVSAINDTVGFLVLGIFLLDLANWVTGFGRLGRFVECANLLFVVCKGIGGASQAVYLQGC